MQKTIIGESTSAGSLGIDQLLLELEKDKPVKSIPIPASKASSHKSVILEVLARAADDDKFLARLAEDPCKVLQQYNLSLEERAALASGDLRQIEGWVGKLDNRLSTWIWCILQQEKW